jgi:hypothetical protein
VTKRDQHQVAYAVLELADAEDELRAEAERARAEGAPDLAAALASAMALIRDASARLEERVSGVPGLPVAETAEYLRVSEPTVRAWIARGLLESVAGATPVVVDPTSVRQVGRLVQELRERGQDRDWTQALVDLLHDRDELARPEIVQGLEGLGGGKLEPA